MAFVVFAVRVDNRDLNTINETDGIDSYLAIIEAVIDPFHGRPVKNARCVMEGDAMPSDVDAVLVWRPGESRLVYLHYVFTIFKRRDSQ
jgi:hypothetical protein